MQIASLQLSCYPAFYCFHHRVIFAMTYTVHENCSCLQTKEFVRTEAEHEILLTLTILFLVFVIRAITESYNFPRTSKLLRLLRLSLHLKSS